MGTLKTLSKRMTKLAEDLPVRASKLASDTAYEVISELVSSPPTGTPVDTTNAESNWRIGLGEKPTGTIGPHVPGSKGSTQGESATAVLNAAATALATKKPGQTIYISNAVPYIRRLAYDGHSRQSPPGWVEGAVLIGRKFIAKARARFLVK